jgi:phage terminase large subunit GpA-like protein
MKPHDGFLAYVQAFAEGLRPDKPLWIDEWAEEHMQIPAETGAAEPGRYRVERTPYARAVMRALSPEHPARRVVVKGASQLLKTQIGLNWLFALIDKSPANAIMLQPTDRLAKRVSARFDKTVNAVPTVKQKVAVKRSRDSKNTCDTKEFKGGTLWILTGRSASNLSEASARYVYADEVDRIVREIRGEGDPIALLEKRQSTFGRKAKSYYTSSPTEEDASRIDELFREGDQQYCYVPCPHCGEYQTLEWENLRADFDQGRVWMICVSCGSMIEEHHKPFMFDNHQWRAAAPGGETASFTISYLYAPLGWDSWLKLAQEHRDAEIELNGGSKEKMQVFWNTRLARTWTLISARIKPEVLHQRAESYRLGIAPKGALIATASVDVQGNRLEMLIVGWGPGETGLECWVINHHVFFGDPTLPDVWRELEIHLQLPIATASGAEMIISACCIDSGDGDSSTEVYEFVRTRRRRYIRGQLQAVLAVKGASHSGKPIIAGKPGKVDYNYRGRPQHHGAEVWLIGTDVAKDWIFNRLALEGQQVIHLSKELDIEFFRQLLAEVKVTRWVNKKKRKIYEKIKIGQPNEALDMVVYAVGGAWFLGLDRYSGARWNKVAAELRQPDIFQSVETAPIPVTEAPQLQAKTAISSTKAANSPILAPQTPPLKRKYTRSGLGRDDWLL